MTSWSGGAPRSTRPFTARLSARDIREFVGLADTDPPGSSWARQVGRRLALHPLLANPSHDGLDVVLDVLSQARPLMVAVGVHFDVIRIRRGCAVVRALPLRASSPGVACQICRGLLETVPATARGIRGTVVETTCRERGAEACLFTLLWDATLGVMALYRPYARHGPWAAQMANGPTYVLDPELVPPQPTSPVGRGMPDDGSGEIDDGTVVDGPPLGPAIVVDGGAPDRSPSADPPSAPVGPDTADGPAAPPTFGRTTDRDPEGRGGIARDDRGTPAIYPSDCASGATGCCEIGGCSLLQWGNRSRPAAGGRRMQVQISMMEKVAMERTGPQGGVINLLKMAKTQSGVAMAFAALRRDDGTFALATFPSAVPDGRWTIEAIDELVRQIWSDPHLGGGRVLVRSGRIPGAEWPGDNHQSKVAVAPLSDLATTDRPWGLLAVVDPVNGQFEQDHLDLIGGLAIRLTAYLRARQEVVENVFTVVGEPSIGPDVPWTDARPDASSRSASTQAQSDRAQSDNAPSGNAPSGRAQSDSDWRGDEPSDSDRRQDDVPDEAPADSVRRGEDRLGDDRLDLGWTTPPSEPPTRRAPEPPPTRPEPVREYLGADELLNLANAAPVVEWYRGATRTSSSRSPSRSAGSTSTGSDGSIFEDAPDLDDWAAAPPMVAEAAMAADVPERAEPKRSDPSLFSVPPADRGRADWDLIADANDVVGTVLRADPQTGLAGLPSVLVHLGGAVATLNRGATGSVAVVLVEVSSPGSGLVPIPDATFGAVAERLQNHVRTGDLIGRIGRTTIAVVANVRSGAEDGPRIERRLVDVALSVLLQGAPGAAIRSAYTTAVADMSVGAEELLRQAMVRLAEG